MALPALSIVIPTHKRAEILAQCLERIEKQTIAKQLELIVVSDGHDAATMNLLEHIGQNEGGRNASLASYKFFEIPKSQQGMARNRGVQDATADIILFIGDDAFLAPDACEKHLAAHRAHHQNVAVLGFTTWDTALNITPAMRWLEETGWQFGYNMLIPYKHAFVPPHMQHRFSYTANISVPTSVARAEPFRTDVTLYGWEDIVWGQQLQKAGISLYYEPDALALHHHVVTLEDSLARIHTLGQSLRHLTNIAPTLDRRPQGLKLWAYKLVSLLPTMRGKHYRSFLRGLEASN